MGRYRQAENWLIEALQIGARVAGRMASDAEFACGNLQWLYDSEGRLDKVLYVSRICPGTGLPLRSDRELALIWNHLFEVRALWAAGYRQAAIAEFERIDRLRIEHIRSTPDRQPHILVQLYLTANELQLFERAIELHHELTAWLGLSADGAFLLLDELNLELNLIRLHFSRDYAALLQSGLFGTDSPTLQAIADRFAREYYQAAGQKGPSHPDNLSYALAYLDVLQVANRQDDFGRFLDDVMQEHTHWAKEIPRRHLALVLKALNFAAHTHDWQRADLYFDQYVALRDFAVDDATAIATVLRNLKQALDTEPHSDVPWAHKLELELNQAHKVAVQREHEPYSQSLIDRIVEQAAKDPAIARLAVFRFK